MNNVFAMHHEMFLFLITLDRRKLYNKIIHFKSYGNYEKFYFICVLVIIIP